MPFSTYPVKSSSVHVGELRLAVITFASAVCSCLAYAHIAVEIVPNVK